MDKSLAYMDKISAWDVYLKIQEKSCLNNNARSVVSLNSVAEEFGLSTAIAEEYAIMLHMLDLIVFDADRKEIVHAI